MVASLLAAAAAMSANPSETQSAAESLQLWYTRPARHWVEALPVGNGRLGAMVFGGAASERIQLNEDSLWSGGPEEPDNPSAHQHLAEIRRLLFEGKNVEAQELVYRHFGCQGQGSGHGNGANVPYGSYQTLGDLRLEFGGIGEELSEYRRALNLSTAIAATSFTVAGVRHTREVFSSHPDQVLVVRIAAERAGQVELTARLDRPERFTTRAEGQDELAMRGHLNNGRGGDGMAYVVRLKVLPQGGRVEAAGETLRVVGADSVTLLLTAATDYPGLLGQVRGAARPDPEAITRKQMDNAARKSFVRLRGASVADHRRLFDRVRMRLGPDNPKTASLPTDERLAAFARSAADPGLAALYYQFGRYLLICSSRPGSLPANLQGLWADTVQTPWNGDYHLNINVQMNYWPAEAANLSECHLPLFDLIESLVEPGRKTARAYYAARGWVAHVITNVWGFTAPGEHPSWGATNNGGAWLTRHLWEHYLYTRDRAFLKRAYPMLKEAALFYLDFLTPHPGTGWLVTAPSNSPENAFRLPDGRTASVCAGPTMDSQIVRELFAHARDAAKELGVDADLRAQWEQASAKLPPMRVGRHGQLMEWLEDYDEAEPTHRHVSHLYGLHPSWQITRKGTPELAAAARETLERRGDISTGWSMAWKICFWARLGDGDHAYRLLQGLLRPVMDQSFNMRDGGGSYPNLFCAHPPFQIDGNFGGAAGIGEMLLQATLEEIELLPALPAAWPEGSVSGLRAPGGFELAFAWSAGQLREVTLKSLLGRSCRLRLGERVVEVRLPRGATARFDGRLERREPGAGARR